MKKAVIVTIFGLIAGLASGYGDHHEKKEGHGHAAAEAVIPPAVTPSPEGAKVYIIGLKNGKKVGKNVTVKFGLKGMGVAPAGLYLENTGHHHLLIDMDASELPKGAPIPTIEGKCLHFGKGQTETDITLTPGKHTLQLVFANYSHLLHEPAVISKKITVEVE